MSIYSNIDDVVSCKVTWAGKSAHDLLESRT